MSDSLIHTEALKDKSLWLAVLAPALVLAGKVFGVDLSVDQVLALIVPVVGFIVSSKLKQAHVASSVAKSTPDLESLKKALESIMAASEAKPDESAK